MDEWNDYCKTKELPEFIQTILSEARIMLRKKEYDKTFQSCCCGNDKCIRISKKWYAMFREKPTLSQIKTNAYREALEQCCNEHAREL